LKSPTFVACHDDRDKTELAKIQNKFMAKFLSVQFLSGVYGSDFAVRFCIAFSQAGSRKSFQFKRCISMRFQAAV
jgi:hypothetical protein